MIDNISKPTDFYLNYPKGFNIENYKTQEPIVEKDKAVANNVASENIFCMKYGTELFSTAVYYKKCDKKVDKFILAIPKTQFRQRKILF